MTSPVSHSIDDKDLLDDAALWAVIDSAEASHSSSKSRKPLAVKHSNFKASPLSFSSPSPPSSKLPQSRIYHLTSDPYRRPHKVARSSVASEVTDSSSPLSAVRTPVLNAYKAGGYSSPEAYLSPQIGKFGEKEVNNEGSEISIGSYARNGEGNDLMRHCLNGKFPTVSLFKDYQNAAMAILEKSDYIIISGHPYIKKSGWRKISFYFNVSYEIKDKNIEFDENRNVQRAEFVVRAYMQGGRFSDGWGSCERREKKFMKPNNDIPSTAETRAKNKACQDLIGIGEYRPGVSQHHQ